MLIYQETVAQADTERTIGFEFGLGPWPVAPVIRVGHFVIVLQMHPSSHLQKHSAAVTDAEGQCQRKQQVDPRGFPDVGIPQGGAVVGVDITRYPSQLQRWPPENLYLLFFQDKELESQRRAQVVGIECS